MRNDAPDDEIAELDSGHHFELSAIEVIEDEPLCSLRRGHLEGPDEQTFDFPIQRPTIDGAVAVRDTGRMPVLEDIEKLVTPELLRRFAFEVGWARRGTDECLCPHCRAPLEFISEGPLARWRCCG